MRVFSIFCAGLFLCFPLISESSGSFPDSVSADTSLSVAFTDSVYSWDDSASWPTRIPGDVERARALGLHEKEYSSGKATYVIAPDGSGDFPTIQAGINAASSGDIINLLDGTYRGHGNWEINFFGKAILLRSQSGNPELCIIDCESGQVGFIIDSGEGAGTVISGLTIMNGSGGSAGGGGIRCYNYSSPTIENCIFRQNTSDTGGGMICHTGSSPTINNCVFYDNFPLRGGGLSCYHSSSPQINNCSFVFNRADRRDYGGAIYLLDNCSPIIENSIFAFNEDEAIFVRPGDSANCNPILSCCNVFGNQYGDWVGPIWNQLGINGNISEDPIFCDSVAGDFTLNQASPCSQENNPDCGQIGALPVGCGYSVYFVSMSGSDETGDGSTDNPYATIQKAVNVAAPDGDTIILKDEVFTGPGNSNIQLFEKNIILRSESGMPEQCIIDCQGEFEEVIAGPPTGSRFNIDGIWIRNATGMALSLSNNDVISNCIISDCGIGLYLDGSMEITNSIFKNNGTGIFCGPNLGIVNATHFENNGYGIYSMAGAGGMALAISDCTFLGNESGIYVNVWKNGREWEDPARSERIFTNCDFINNGSGAGGTLNAEFLACSFVDNNVAIWASSMSGFDFLLVTDCEISGGETGISVWSKCGFTLNNSQIIDHLGDAIILQGADPVTMNNSLISTNVGRGLFIDTYLHPAGQLVLDQMTIANNGTGLEFISPYEDAISELIIQNSIFANNDGFGIISDMALGNSVHLNCSDIFGNSGGDWVDEIADQLGVNGNISEDPLFCDPYLGDFTLDQASPCAQENNPECGQIGALPVGCVVIVEPDCLDYAEFSSPPIPMIGTLDTEGEASSIAVSGNLAFIADGPDGLIIVDVEAPDSPSIVGTMETPGTSWGVAVAGDQVVVADGEAGLLVVDVSTPSVPAIVGTADTDGLAFAVEVVGNLAYVADVNGGLQVVDISNPDNPTVVGSAATPGEAWGLKVVGGLAYVSAGYSGLQVVDISNPATPEIIGSIDTPGDASGIVILANLAYLADGTSVQILDVSIPTDPTIIGTLATGDQSYALRIYGEYLYVADRLAGVRVFDLIDPQAPNLIGTIYTPGEAFWVAASDGMLFVADFLEGLQICYPQCGTELDIATLMPQPAEIGPIDCAEPTVLNFQYTPAPSSGPVKGYSVRIVAGNSVSFSSSDFTVNNLPPDEDVFFQIVENGTNDFTLDYTILGSTTGGIATPGSLFSILFHGEEDGAAAVSISEAEFRDLDNLTIPLDFGSSATILVDCGPPDGVSNALAVPGHERVTITWDDPPTGGFVEIEVYRGLWHDGSLGTAYPDYGQLTGNTIPGQFSEYSQYVASSEWELAGSVSPGIGEFFDPVVNRGIYFYQVFALDQAGNASPTLAESPAATNYILGDVALPYDGEVGIADLSVLGDSYGVGCGHEYYNAETDVGPTDNASSQGLPLPDCAIGFEDLLIFAFNYGTPVAKTEFPSECDELILSWVQKSDLEWSCILSEPCPALKGVHLVSDITGLGNANIERGALLSQQPTPVFLQKVDSPKLDVGLAIMGGGQGFEGGGELFRVSLSEPTANFNVIVEARSTTNESINVQLLDHEISTLPTRFALGHNYPNPFNPSTTISFSLPEAHEVSLCIYSVDGRRIRSLASGLRPAGVYEVVWEGRDDRGHGVATGIYFYRLEAGAFRETRKMVLMK